jgi:hypothetical protein
MDRTAGKNLIIGYIGKVVIEKTTYPAGAKNQDKPGYNE